jgi:crossover junction endodeoxyribonuclease RusA
MTVTLQLPLPPSANRLWVRARKGMRRSDEYVAWLLEAGWTAKTQRPNSIKGPFKISIHASRPDKRRRDIDNLIKPTLDLVESLRIVENDSDCEQVSARWVTTGAGVTIIVEQAGVEEEYEPR